MRKMKNIGCILVFALFISLVTGSFAKAASKFTCSASYTNPECSGTITAESENGATYYSNDVISKKQLTLDNVAADSCEADQEICLGIDQYGTVWVVYRNQGIYWYNAEIIGKKGVIQKWSGITDSQSIKATRLCFKESSGSFKYTGLTYVNYYTSGKDLEDYPLPTWKELYYVFNGEEYKEEVLPTPTAIPTATPTVESTQVPTAIPTATPTVESTQVPTAIPTVEPTQKPGNGSLTEGGNANAPDSNANGGNAQEAIVDNNINGDGNSTSTVIDQDIVINNTVTDVTVNGNNNSVGTSVGTAANALPIKPAIVSTSTKKKSTVKSKSYYGAIQSGFRLKLYKVTQKVSKGKIKNVRQWKSICLFDKKKERMDWNAFKLKKVKKCQFSNKKRWIVIIRKNGKVYACPSGKGTKKVKYIGKGAVAFKCNSRGLATSYVKKNGTVVKLKY